MLRLKRNLWKVGKVLVGMLLLLVCMVWIPVSAGYTRNGHGAGNADGRCDSNRIEQREVGAGSSATQGTERAKLLPMASG